MAMASAIHWPVPPRTFTEKKPRADNLTGQLAWQVHASRQVPDTAHSACCNSALVIDSIGSASSWSMR